MLKEAVKKSDQEASDLPVWAIDLPVLYEDEGQEEMGDNALHTETIFAIYLALLSHFSGRENWHIFVNLNLHYHPIKPGAYVSPDIMVVNAPIPQGSERGSYRVGEDGPAPVLTIEVLSERTYQQQDISPTGKPVVYGELGVPEYILVDVSGRYLPERLLLKRLQLGKKDAHDRPMWLDEQDLYGGVTSRLGFRLQIEKGHLEVIDTRSGRIYLRPEEAEKRFYEEQQAKLKAEARMDKLEARLVELENQIKYVDKDE